MRGRHLLVFVFLPFLFGFDLLHSQNRAVEEGNAKLRAGKADDALALYDKAARSLPQDASVQFNRGAALFALQRFDEAGQAFLHATEAKAPGLKAAAFYNLGNTFFKGNKFKEAIEAYKRSLAIDPRGEHAKWNLELALRKKQEEDKKDQDKKDQDKKDRDKGDKKDKPKPDQNKQDQKKPDEKKPEPPDKTPEPKPGQERPQPQPQPGEKPPSEQEIEAVLDSLEHSPKDLERERARLRAVRRRPPAKDW